MAKCLAYNKHSVILAIIINKNNLPLYNQQPEHWRPGASHSCEWAVIVAPTPRVGDGSYLVQFVPQETCLACPLGHSSFHLQIYYWELQLSPVSLNYIRRIRRCSARRKQDLAIWFQEDLKGQRWKAKVKKKGALSFCSDNQQSEWEWELWKFRINVFSKNSQPG